MRYHADTRSVEILRKTTIPISKTVSLGQGMSDLYDRFSTFLAPLNLTFYFRERPIMGHFRDVDRLLRVAGVADLALYNMKRANFYDIYPSSVKKIIGGSGSAQKEAVARGLEMYVGPQEYATNDESDAVGVGVAYLVKEG